MRVCLLAASNCKKCRKTQTGAPQNCTSHNVSTHSLGRSGVRGPEPAPHTPCPSPGNARLLELGSVPKYSGDTYSHFRWGRKRCEDYKSRVCLLAASNCKKCRKTQTGAPQNCRAFQP